MRQWLFRLWNEEARFKQGVRALALGLGLAIAGPAGAEIITGEFSEISSAEWWRFALSAIIGAAGGSIAVGEKNTPPGEPPLETDSGVK